MVSDGLFKELSAPALPPSNGGSDAPIANQLCAVASIPLPGLRRRSARARTRGQADRRATIFSLFGEETTIDDELCCRVRRTRRMINDYPERWITWLVGR